MEVITSGKLARGRRGSGGGSSGACGTGSRRVLPVRPRLFHRCGGGAASRSSTVTEWPSFAKEHRRGPPGHPTADYEDLRHRVPSFGFVPDDSTDSLDDGPRSRDEPAAAGPCSILRSRTQPRYGANRRGDQRRCGRPGRCSIVAEARSEGTHFFDMEAPPDPAMVLVDPSGGERPDFVVPYFDDLCPAARPGHERRRRRPAAQHLPHACPARRSRATRTTSTTSSSCSRARCTTATRSCSVGRCVPPSRHAVHVHGRYPRVR